MKYDAIIFDLFGTLVDTFPPEAFERLLMEIAEILAVPQKEFRRLWNIETWPMRARGDFPTLEATFAYVCQRLNVPVSDEQLKRAAQKRISYTEQMLVPRHDVVETLTILKGAGYKIGLISDCTVEVPQYWEQTLLAPLIDFPVFSCSVHLKKPDSRIYALACERLGVLAQHCLYIGDGASRELSGARAVGMDAILIRVQYEESALHSKHRPEEEMWTGPRIASIKGVLPFVDQDLCK